MRPSPGRRPRATRARPPSSRSPRRAPPRSAPDRACWPARPWSARGAGSALRPRGGSGSSGRAAARRAGAPGGSTRWRTSRTGNRAPSRTCRRRASGRTCLPGPGRPCPRLGPGSGAPSARRGAGWPRPSACGRRRRRPRPAWPAPPAARGRAWGTGRGHAASTPTCPTCSPRSSSSLQPLFAHSRSYVPGASGIEPVVYNRTRPSDHSMRVFAPCTRGMPCAASRQ